MIRAPVSPTLLLLAIVLMTINVVVLVVARRLGATIRFAMRQSHNYVFFGKGG